MNTITQCGRIWALLVLVTGGLFACNSENGRIEDVLAGPKAFVGSEQCKLCHLEHYDSWKTTNHSRTLQDAEENRDALVASLDPEIIRADLEKSQEELRVPVDEIYIPKADEIKYTIGIQWRQRFLVEKNGRLFIAPIQYNTWNDTWVSYRESDWDTRPWINECGGCHAVGVDIEENTFAEPIVGCEACHGPGSHHVALPKTAVFDKRLTIVNPSKLSTGIRNQICGACHSRGSSTQVENTDWPVGYTVGKALGPFLKGARVAPGDIKDVMSEEMADFHHQQYQEWQLSIHAQKGVSCTSCHYVHQLGVPPTEFQTLASGSQQCLMCHTMFRPTYAHALHSFSNCVGCHMPSILKSPESGDLHLHTFRFLSPEESLRKGGTDEQPNACSSCHHHKDTPLEALVGFMESSVQNSMPMPLDVHKRPAAGRR